MNQSRVFVIAIVLFSLPSLSRSDQAPENTKTKICFSDAPDVCYTLPIGASQRDFNNRLGDEGGFSRDSFTNDSCSWSRCGKIAYFFPGDKRMNEMLRIPGHPMIQSGIAATCKNLDMLNRMRAGAEKEKAIEITKKAFDRIKEKTLKAVSARIEKLSSMTEKTPSEDEELRELTRYREEIHASHLIDPIDEKIESAFHIYCKDQTFYLFLIPKESV